MTSEELANTHCKEVNVNFPSHARASIILYPSDWVS